MNSAAGIERIDKRIADIGVAVIANAIRPSGCRETGTERNEGSRIIVGDDDTGAGDNELIGLRCVDCRYSSKACSDSRIPCPTGVGALENVAAAIVTHIDGLRITNGKRA